MKTQVSPGFVRLLIEQAEMEYQTALQAAFFAGQVDVSEIAHAFEQLAIDELKHFASLSRILRQIGYQFDSKALPLKGEIKIEPLKAMVIVLASEDSMIKSYEYLLSFQSSLKPDVKKVLESNLADEKEHQAAMAGLMTGVKNGAEG